MATNVEILALVKSLTPKGVSQSLAQDANAIDSAIALLLLEDGYATAAAIPSTSLAKFVYRLAYNVTLAALDIVRTKVKRAEATPASAEFRAEEDYLEKLLKRLASRAGINDGGVIKFDPPYDLSSVDHFTDLPTDDLSAFP